MPMTDQVWIVDDDSSIRWVMEKALSRAGVNCRAFETGLILKGGAIVLIFRWATAVATATS